MGKKVLVVGDLIVDEYVYGTVDRISPEAPVPVLNYQDSRKELGGAGIVAECLGALGMEPLLCAAVGNDGNREIVNRLCDAHGIGCGGLVSEEGRHTTLKTRYVATSPFWQYILRVDREHAAPVSAKTEQALAAFIGARLKGCECAVVSDYSKGVMTQKVIGELLSQAKKAGKPVLVDAKKMIADYRGAAIIAPNRKELFDHFGQKYDRSIKVARGLAGRLAKEMECAVVVKLGEDGVLMVHGAKELHIPTEAKKIVNVSGAGDVFIAVMASAIAQGKDFETALRLANKGAGIAVGKTTPRVNADELK